MPSKMIASYPPCAIMGSTNIRATEYHKNMAGSNATASNTRILIKHNPFSYYLYNQDALNVLPVDIRQ